MSQKLFWSISFVLSLFLVAACAPKTTRVELAEKNNTLVKSLKRSQNFLLQTRSQEQKKLQKITPKPKLNIQPVLPEFNPLENTPITLSVRDTSLADILYLIAKNAGLNLVIEPEISPENKVTIEFENTPSNLVLDKLLQAYDLAYELKDNVLYIKKYVEKTFELNFLNTATSVSIDNGGDIFGASSIGSNNQGSAGIKGNFQLTNKLSNDLSKNSIYGLIQTTVQKILGVSTQGGSANPTQDNSALDPVSGTLYVKTTPQKMQAVSKFLHTLQQKMQRQVVIDAQILEVTLSDNFRYGIDWNYFAQRLINNYAYSMDLAVNTLSQNNIPITIVTNKGSTMSASSSTSTINPIITAIREFGNVSVVASPHLLVRNGQPGLFTSGTSLRYVDSITREQNDNGVTYTVEPASVFDGIMLGVVPFIFNPDTVNLQIFPIKSLVDKTSLNLIDVTNSGDRISLPRVEVKNVNTNVIVHNGDVIILGGLIDKVGTKNDNKVPVLGDIPILGKLFRSNDHRSQIREMVIIMKVKIL